MTYLHSLYDLTMYLDRYSQTCNMIRFDSKLHCKRFVEESNKGTNKERNSTVRKYYVPLGTQPTWYYCTVQVLFLSLLFFFRL